MQFSFITIPSKQVEFENGDLVTVPEFEVSRDVVNIDQYREFQKGTGYKTVAEINDDPCYYNNDMVLYIPEQEKKWAPACCMCYLDAIAFCEWSGFRLPTESEYLAYSIFYEKLYDREANESPPEKYGIVDRVFKYEDATSNPVYVEPHEITATFEHGKNVHRCGPINYRETKWKQYVNGNRLLEAKSSYDLMNSFRVCKIKE